MLVDIYVREKNGTREIRVPILPEKIPSNGGDATEVSYSIMNLGEVAIPSGTERDSWTWESEFPGEYRNNDPLIRGTWRPPSEYDSILKDWKKNGTELTLLAIGYPINADVYLTEYHPTAAGAFGDIYYDITFKEARRIVVTSTKVEEPKETTRPTEVSSTYIIKSGDTLWGIARKFYGDGTKWKTIYDANKGIIESTAKSRGYKSSDNGHWIFPGVKLTIPGVGSSSTSSGSTSTSSTAASTATKSVDELAREVIQGKWGNGSARKERLTAAGYDYNAVQARVNELLS